MQEAAHFQFVLENAAMRLKPRSQNARVAYEDAFSLTAFARLTTLIYAFSNTLPLCAFRADRVQASLAVSFR